MKYKLTEEKETTMSKYIKQFIEEYETSRGNKTEIKFRKAIHDGTVKPTMSLREMGRVLGINHPETVKYYLNKFKKDIK